jgi:hypothetical protein
MSVVSLRCEQNSFPVDKIYTVKKIYRIPVNFFTKPFRNGKTPYADKEFLVPSREGIFCLLRREKYSSFCRGNFFLSVECYISLFLLQYFPIEFTGKLMEDSWLAKGAPGRVAINSAAEKKLWPLLLNCKCELVKILVNQSYYYKES